MTHGLSIINTTRNTLITFPYTLPLNLHKIIVGKLFELAKNYIALSWGLRNKMVKGL